jgi:hypothetical protein
MDRIRTIAREAKDANGEAIFPAIPDNAFRHSYISHALAATGNIARVSLDAGNSPKEINRHYRELVTEEEGKAWFEIFPEKLPTTTSGNEGRQETRPIVQGYRVKKPREETLMLL